MTPAAVRLEGIVKRFGRVEVDDFEHFAVVRGWKEPQSL